MHATRRVARHYADVLAQRLGTDRLRLIAEAFRPRIGGGFRPATLDELRPQLAAYGGQRVFLFAGRHRFDGTPAPRCAAFYLAAFAVGHVEAGLRTGDIYAPYPEEMNRRLVDDIATRPHFSADRDTRAPRASAPKARNKPDKIHVTGNTVIDALLIMGASG